MHNENTLQLNEHAIRKGKSILRAIDHPLRQEILQLIHRTGRMIVTDIYHTLEIEQSVASQQLAILRAAKIVKAERHSKNVFYSVNYERVKDIHLVSEKLLQ